MAIPISIRLEVRMSPPTSSISARSMTIADRLAMRTTPISAAAMTYGRSVDVGAENTRLSRMAAAHAVFDSVEEDLECGCRLAIRRCRNLNFHRLDCFRLRIEIHLDGAAVDPQL